MEWESLVALAFNVEAREALTRDDITLEATDLALMQELLAEGVLGPNIRTRSRCPHEVFTIHGAEMLGHVPFPGIALVLASACQV